MPAEEALSSLREVSAHADILSEQLSLYVADGVESLVHARSSNEEMAAAFNVLSNLIGSSSAKSPLLADKVIQIAEKAVSASLEAGKELQVESSKIAIKVAPLDSSSKSTVSPSASSELQVGLPSGLAPAGSTLASVLYKTPLH